MNKLRASVTRRQQARQLNAVIDAALTDLSSHQQQKVLHLRDNSNIQQLVERIRKRATLLGKKRSRETQGILEARDALIMALYASTAPQGWAVAWCDGSRMKIDSHHCAGIGGIVMDGNGSIIIRFSQTIDAQDAFTAELAALASVMRGAIEHQQQRLYVFTDNHGLAQLWRKQRDDERLAGIRELTAGLERFSLKAIPRQHNQPANALAQRAARGEHKSKTIRAILFDYGGVLAEEGFRNGLVALATEQGLDVPNIPKTGMQAVYDSGFVLGKGTVTDFWMLMRQRTGLTGDDDKLSKHILDGFIIRPWMIEQVRQLHTRGYITGILSDQTHWLDTLDRRNHFYQVFDKIYNSYYLGKGKRDLSLFTDVAADLNIPPAAIVLVDDDAGNIARALEAGLRTIQYTDKKDFKLELETVLSAEY